MQLIHYLLLYLLRFLLWTMLLESWDSFRPCRIAATHPSRVNTIVLIISPIRKREFALSMASGL